MLVAAASSSVTEAGVSLNVPAKPKTIDDYLATVPLDRRRALAALRATIHGVLPEAEECISYSMPAFRHDGHVVAGFLATAKGCSYFPFSGTTLAMLATELRAYSQTKSALHFEPERPLSKALVTKLLKARIAESDGKRLATRAQATKRTASKARAVPKGRTVSKARGVPKGRTASKASPVPTTGAARTAKGSPRAQRAKG